VEKLLDALHLNYESEWDEFAPWTLDCWLPEWWAAIEVDGPSHSKTKDVRRDEDLLTRYGVKVLHLDVRGYFDPAYATKRVLAFIQESAQDARERRRTWQVV
jgi:very-short-patch-repair endonuclease